ncbi:hypothetical protein ACFQZI_00045 [Mucilaginibacter lutimaris]|uniref:Uncharacterized protein n=1 Tax=Mucilaginibacter lutimaris TaxID=931629 RepID=A0ABW2ZBA6_9SPHI
MSTNAAQFCVQPGAIPLNEVKVSADIFIAGYPTSLGVEGYLDFFDIDRPVLRKGIASHVNYKSQRIIPDRSNQYKRCPGPVKRLRRSFDREALKL